MMVHFLFLFRTPKDDIISCTSENQTSKMLQLVLKLIIKVTKAKLLYMG